MEKEYISAIDVVLTTIIRFWPTWAAIIVVVLGGWTVRGRIGLFGRLYNSPVGMIGAIMLLFWIFTAIFADMIAVMGPSDVSFSPGIKKGAPGIIDVPNNIVMLWGADNIARDIFSRVVWGSQTVLIIAPAATAIAYMVGITLGLPAGYFGKQTDTVLSFLANLILAFPVILLFYLLVTPEIRQAVYYDIGPFTIPFSIPIGIAGVFFLFPIIFVSTLWFTKYEHSPKKLMIYMGITLVVGFWMYAGLVFGADYTPFKLDSSELNVFVAVVLGSSPGVFRIVRGLTMDIATRDYVAAAQTRGERAWYIMLWEILPNARGPLIVDSCLRIGYTTILLGTLGFFGLGLSPDSPDWGTMINHGRPFVRLMSTIHLSLFPAIALMSMVLGLNLLADGLREESMKD